MEAMEETGGGDLHLCPGVLLEEKFLLRLKGGKDGYGSGSAKRSLNTLGALSKIAKYLSEACYRAYALRASADLITGMVIHILIPVFSNITSLHRGGV
jgi:hypothetical protein